MKTITLILLVGTTLCQAQTIVGTWQMTEQKTCFQSQFEESDTEKELKDAKGTAKTGVAKIIKFGAKGQGEEGVFSQGKKKGSGLNQFKYQVVDQELHFLDKKSGIITERFIIEELSATTLRIHNANRDCEVRTFAKVK